MTGELLPDRVRKDGEGGDRSQEQGAARRQQERETAHRDQQQQPQAAGNAAAGVQQATSSCRYRRLPGESSGYGLSPGAGAP